MMTDVIAGVDTHADTHQVALINPDGTAIDCRQFTTDLDGLYQARDWLLEHGASLAGIEGSSSYGAGLVTVLHAAGIRVVEVTRPNRADRRRLGKSDTIDAYMAAEAARTGQRTSPVKHHQRLAELRVHYTAHESAVTSRTQAGNQLRHAWALLNPGHRLGALTLTTVRHLAEDPHPGIALLAQRWLMLHDEATAHHNAITAWLRRHHHTLLDQVGVGPITAAELVLVAGDNPDRMHTEASFAAAIGVAPIRASSGRTTRHRLNRGGDRRGNRAIWRIAFTRAHHEPRSMAYLERRDPHRKNPKATLRCLMRYICREIFPILKAATT